MARRIQTDKVTEHHGWVGPALLLVLAFLSPGAWMLTRLPVVPAAKALNLATVGVWMIATALGVVALVAISRRLAFAVGGVAVASLFSFLLGGHWFQTLFYDLYANMPLVQWAAYPVMFVLAASMLLSREVLQHSVAVLLGVGTVIAAIVIYQGGLVGLVNVFGSTGYTTTALVPLIPLGVTVGAVTRGQSRVVGFSAAGVVAAALGYFTGSLMGALGVLFALVISAAVFAVLKADQITALRPVAMIAAVVAGFLFVGLVAAQIPAISGAAVNARTVGQLGDGNLTSRVQMWEGAQRMLVSRPLVGFGPSGYRVKAVEYMAPEGLQHGADVEGDIDPAVYSPQSPHSLVWEVLTRLGLLGALAFGALFVVWAGLVARRIRDRRSGWELQLGLAAGLVSVLFSLLVNPVIFAIGLLAPVMAGLAVAPVGSSDEKGVGALAKAVMLAGGAVVLALSAWLYVGETRAFGPAPENALERMAHYESSLAVIPGHPVTERRLFELRLFVAPNDVAAANIHAEIDAAPGYLYAYAPNLVSIAAHSLTQAERTGRVDLSWERSMLDLAERQLPPIPSLVAERLRLELLSGDAASVQTALEQARLWGGPYPLNEGYIARAEEALAQ